jgi:hypothetical protein
LPEISYDKYDKDEENDDLLDLGGAEGKLPVSLKQTEFSLKQFAKRMGQADYSTFNKWKNGSVAGFLEKEHRSIIQGQNRLKQLRDRPLHWKTAIAEFLETLEMWLALNNFDSEMHSSAVGGDVSAEMCKRNSGSKEKGKLRQQATSDGFGKAHEQNGEK